MYPVQLQNNLLGLNVRMLELKEKEARLESENAELSQHLREQEERV